MSLDPCPCGSGNGYEGCCGAYHHGKVLPETAEQLMRSRYSAYARHLVDYLVETTHPDRRNPRLAEEIAAWAGQVEFTRLEIRRCQQGGPRHKLGKVEFTAHYRQGGEARQLRELSRFKRYRKRWMYLDGSFPEED